MHFVQEDDDWLKRKRLIKMDGLLEYIDNCVKIVITAYTADVFFRLFRASIEYFKYKNHYFPENRLWTILCRAYTYDASAIVILLGALGLSVILFSFNRDLHLIPSLNYLKYIPIYWLLRYSNFEHSTLDYAAFIRGNHGLDSASSMAANFFHGYLKLTLPAYINNSGIRERIDLYEQTHDVRFATDRLIIIVPSRLFIKSKFESPYLEKAEPLPKVYRDRAGVYRPYQNDVYRLTKPINGRFYYMALEGATPILTFFETLSFQRTTTKQIEEMQREILLKFYKYLKNLVEKWPETAEETELIFYDEYKPNGEKHDIGEMLHNYFKNKLLSKESLDVDEGIESIHD